MDYPQFSELANGIYVLVHRLSNPDAFVTQTPFNEGCTNNFSLRNGWKLINLSV